MSLLINDEFRELIPSLSDSEYAELEQSILAEGCREALVVWNGTIVDGHNRYEICTKHGIPLRTREVQFASEDEAKLWIISNQLARRNISEYARFELVEKRKSILLEMGRQKQQSAGREARDKQLGVLSIIDKTPEEPHDTRQQLASELGWSTGKVAMAEVVLKSAPEPIKDKLRTGDLSVNQAYNEVRKRVQEQKIEQQKAAIEKGEIVRPDGLYDIIACDPPWPYGTEYDPAGRRAANPYPEMPLEDIAAIELPASGNCILFLWTTHKFMRYSFGLLDNWGFRDVAIITWVKDKMGLGTWLRSQSEFCIMAVRGTPHVTLTNQTTVLYGKRREHSRKPDEFYDMVNSLCIGRKLDYFARERRPGWDIFGVEEQCAGKIK